MLTPKIAFLDSGIGGISTMLYAQNKIPNAQYIYLGDNSNAPYGSKTLRDLKSITIKNLIYILSYKPDALVIACNTLTTSLLPFIKEFCNLPVFGVSPPIEKEIIKGNKVFLICTPITASYYYGLKNVTVLPLQNLAKKIEENKFYLKKECFYEEREIIFKAISKIPNNKKLTTILGCTHYNFAKNLIFDHQKPHNIISGDQITINHLIKQFRPIKNIKIASNNQVIFIGKNANINEKFYFSVVKN